MAHIEKESQRILTALPSNVKHVQKSIRELEEQIDALPDESPLRNEKILVLAKARDDILQDDNWYRYILWREASVADVLRKVRSSAQELAAEERYDVILFSNAPEVDRATGALRYGETPSGAIIPSSNRGLVDVTDRVLKRSLGGK